MSSIKVKSPEGRILWATLTEKDEFGWFSVKMGFEKDTADLDELKDTIKEIATKAFPGQKPGEFTYPIKDGDTETNKKGELIKQDAGQWIVRFKTRQPIQACGPGGGKDVIALSDIYSGCYAKVICNVSDFNVAGNRGVATYLLSIQLTKNGERIGSSSVDMEEEWSAIPGAEKISTPVAPDPTENW